MEDLTGSEIITATGGTLLAGDPSVTVTGVTTDSRKDCTGGLFIPLVGERFDGHAFLSAAVEQGAAAVLTQQPDIALPNHILAVGVTDTRAALQALARYYRSRFPIPVVGITGSVGKTTTKDMVASVLATTYSTLKTEGNFNNEIGLPLTLFGLTRSHQAAVIEMGMSGFGEIDRLASIAQPDCAIITNIGMAHIEKLGSQENIRKAKMEMLPHLRPGGLVLLNGDDPLLWDVRGQVPHAVYVGIHNPDCAFTAVHIQTTESGLTFQLRHAGKAVTVSLPLPGEHNVYNALFAIAVGLHYQVPMSAILTGLADFVPSAMRLAITQAGGYTIVNDCYNASPASMEAAISVLCAQAASRRIAVLGDMLEMGKFAYQAHKNVGSFVHTSGIDELVTVGEHGRSIGEGAFECGMDSACIHSFDTNDEAIRCLSEMIRPGDAVLVKASRGMHFETIAGFLTGKSAKDL